MQRNMQKLRWQHPFILATDTPGQSWKNIVLQSRQDPADCWTNSMWHLLQMKKKKKKKKNAHPQHSNVKTALSQTNTHKKSLKCRRASPPFSEPRGTLQEHRGEVATDLPFSVTSQRSPALLPFHKQPKDHGARLGKLRSHREGKLPKQTSRYKPELAMKPGLYPCEWPLTSRKAIGKMESLKIKMSSWMVADQLLSWWANITASLGSSWTHELNVIFCSWHAWLPISTCPIIIIITLQDNQIKEILYLWLIAVALTTCNQSTMFFTIMQCSF